MSYIRRPSPLHTARAGAGCLYCLSLGIAALTLSSPVALAAITIAIVVAGALAGVGSQIKKAALFALPLGVAVALINALVTRDGLTVIVRLGQLPVLGHTDITLEATAFGAILGLRAVALILCGALYTAAVDPDEVLRLFRRISFRSALTATLATRMVPILARDAKRLADAQRCRPGPPPSKVALMRAATSGLLDRSLDVAAALEVRGYGAAHRPARTKRPYTRHDVAFTASAIALISIAIVAKAADVVPFTAYPALRAPITATALALAAAILACALLPFADRRGLQR